MPGLIFERPFRCTLACCCCLFNPQEMRALDADVPLGGSKMEWECSMCCWPYRRYAIQDAEEHTEYHVQAIRILIHLGSARLRGGRFKRTRSLSTSLAS